MNSLISDIERFCVKARLSERQFGSLAVNDGKFVTQLRAGRDIRISTEQRVRDFMAQYEGGDTVQ